MDENRPTVAVIMSTYNGEKFLREQIESILTQKNVEIMLYIRDDGSNDETPAIIREYSDRYDNVIFWNQNDRCNLGVARSFLGLLSDVMKAEPEIQYFSFADQDDVWLEDKLSAAYEKIRSAVEQENAPVLYYSNKTYVDYDLSNIREEKIRYYGDFFEAMDNAYASGCTMLFNRALAEYAIQGIPQFSYHDAWIYRLAKACDFKIVFSAESNILYRRHGGNVTGMSFLKRAKEAFKKAFIENDHPLQNIFREIYDGYSSILGQKQKKYIEYILDYDHSIISWFRLAFIPEALKRGPVKYGIWLGKLIFHII